MAGKIIADTIETGAGADISTSYVVNGSAKAWVKFTTVTTTAADNSFNISSLDDDGTGDFGINFTNSMSSAEYSAPSSAGEDNRTVYTNFGTVSSSGMDGQVRQTTTNAVVDTARNSIEILGDLA
jgi:hypothetical protein